MKRHIVCMALSLALTMPAAALQRPRTPRPVTKGGPAFMQRLKTFEETQYVTKAVLRNGMTVLVNEFRTNPVVTMSLNVHAGFAYDPENAPGLSALLGRMLLRGTAARGPGAIGRETATLGGNVDVATGYDRVVFDITVPSMQWKKALEIQADAFLGSTMDAGEMKRALQQLDWETEADAGNPRLVALQSLLELGAGARVARHIGVQELSVIGQAALLQHYRRLCQPSQTTLVISGDVEASAALTEVVKWYDKPGASEATLPTVNAGQSGFRYRELRGNVRQCNVLLGFHVPGPASADFAAADVLAAMLGSGNDALITRQLRDRKRIVRDADAELIAAGNRGYLVIRMEQDPANIDKAELGALTEIEILKKEDPDERAVQRAVAWLEREFWLEQQTVAGRAHALARFEELGDWKKMNQYLARLRQVKPADIVKLASGHLNLDNCSVLEYLPSSAEPRNIAAEAVLKSFRELLDSSVQQEMAERETRTELAVEAPRPPSFKFSEVRGTFQKASILRGPELFVREDHTLPVLQIGFFYPGGKLFEKSENNGITSLMIRSLLRGTRDKSAEQIWRQLELYGAELVPVVEDDCFGVLLSVLSQNVDPTLDILAQIINTPKFDDAEIAREKELQLARIRREADCSEGFGLSLFERTLFKGHPYAMTDSGTEAALAAISADAVRGWYKSTIEHRKPIVSIVGDTQGTSLAAYFVRNFSGSRFQDSALPAEFAPALASRATVEEQANGRLSVVSLGFQAPPEGDEDQPAADVLANLLGGDGGWLREQIEERQGLGADVTLAYRPSARAGSFAITAWTNPENEAKVLESIQGEIKRLIDTPLLYKDYRTALNAAMGRNTIERQERLASIRMLTRSVLAGKGLENFQDYPARLQEVGQDDLPDLARRVLNVEKSVTVKLHGHANK